MQNKVTSYTLSKQLAEAGFDSESHCGWWVEYVNQRADDDSTWIYQLNVDDYMVNTVPGEWYEWGLKVKAYDCFDLLMWLNENATGDIYDIVEEMTNKILGYIDPEIKPQEALGQAVLKVVQGE